MLKGKDKFGKFTMWAGECARDGTIGPTINYTTLKLPADIEVESTILRDKAHGLGVICGCYAKFHRQVAHIETSKKFKGES